MTDLLAVPGASRTSPQFRAAFASMVDRNGWDGDAIAAIISRESGFKVDAMNPTPGQTATGLIQFTAATLRGLGWTGTREQFAALDDVDQLLFVEKYFRRAFPSSTPARSVDYYLATWGARAGLPLSHVLATKGDGLYEINAGLDVNGDGTIRVEDLDAALNRTIAKAGGARLPMGKAEPGAASPGSSSGLSASVSLPALRAGSRGAAVELWRELVTRDVPALELVRKASRPYFYDRELEHATKSFQALHRLKPDGVVGNVETWPAMIRILKGAGRG